MQGLESSKSFAGVLKILQTTDNQRKHANAINLVATSHDKAGHGGGGEGRANGHTALVEVGLLVPLAPGLGGCEHATLAAHVSESALA